MKINLRLKENKCAQHVLTYSKYVRNFTVTKSLF